MYSVFTDGIKFSDRAYIRVRGLRPRTVLCEKWSLKMWGQSNGLQLQPNYQVESVNNVESAGLIILTRPSSEVTGNPTRIGSCLRHSETLETGGVKFPRFCPEERKMQSRIGGILAL
jgi:hypothetical protein